MDFRLIDYSAVLHKGSLPPVRKGKFLQIVEDGETEILILSPYELSKYHAQILERYCIGNGLEGRFQRKPDHFLASGADVEVIGGGHWEIDESKSRLTLSGESTVYGRFSAEGLPGKIRALPEFGRYEIVITLPGTLLQR